MYSNQYINNTTCIHKSVLLIRRQEPDPIAIHFNFTEHCVNDYEIVALEQNCSYNSYRKTIEKLWMNKLRTFKPHGLNTNTYRSISRIFYFIDFVTLSIMTNSNVP